MQSFHSKHGRTNMTKNLARGVLGSKLGIAFLACGSVFSLSAYAEPYAGASIGSVSLEANVSGESLDEHDSAGKLIFGYIFDFPVVDLSFEANYVDLGSPSDESTGAKVDISGLDVFVIAGLDFGFVGAFAKAGAIAWDADATAGSFSSSTDGTDTVYGVGLRFNVASLFLRVEYERFDIESVDNVDLFSAGVVWRF